MPAEGASLKERQASRLYASSPTLTTVPFHWEGWSGMVRYASASSLAAACEPGGSREMRRDMVEKVPHVHGYSEESMAALMDEIGDDGVCGKEKSCTRRNLPGLPGLGMMVNGDVWKGPMAASNCSLVKGPRWRFVAYSCCMITRNWAAYCTIDDLLTGAKVCSICGTPMTAPFCKILRTLGYLFTRSCLNM